MCIRTQTTPSDFTRDPSPNRLSNVVSFSSARPLVVIVASCIIYVCCLPLLLVPSVFPSIKSCYQSTTGFVCKSASRTSSFLTFLVHGMCKSFSSVQPSLVTDLQYGTPGSINHKHVFTHDIVGLSSHRCTPYIHNSIMGHRFHLHMMCTCETTPSFVTS